MTNSVARRPYFLDPGEALYSTGSSTALFDGIRAFEEDFGLDSEEYVSSASVVMPFPKTLFKAETQERRRFAVRPDMMWFPLLWLPREMGLRVQIKDPSTGEIRLEGDDEWMIRIAEACVESGLYDQATGTWLDALATVGITDDTPDQADRIRAWQAGGEDPDLDRLNLAEELSYYSPISAERGLLPAPAIIYSTAVALASDVLEVADVIADTAPDLVGDDPVGSWVLKATLSLNLSLASPFWFTDDDRALRLPVEEMYALVKTDEKAAVGRLRGAAAEIVARYQAAAVEHAAAFESQA